MFLYTHLVATTAATNTTAISIARTVQTVPMTAPSRLPYYLSTDTLRHAIDNVQVDFSNGNVKPGLHD
jgi:hypothetical protein